jgi:hypothetical protein
LHDARDKNPGGILPLQKRRSPEEIGRRNIAVACIRRAYLLAHRPGMGLGHVCRQATFCLPARNIIATLRQLPGIIGYTAWLKIRLARAGLRCCRETGFIRLVILKETKHEAGMCIIVAGVWN